jgi:hypothetical protein
VSRTVAGLTCLIMMLCVTNVPAFPPDTAAAATAAGHYLFAWTGDVDKKGMDFLAVIDADAAPSKPETCEHKNVVHFTSSISLGRHSFVKNGSRGL